MVQVVESFELGPVFDFFVALLRVDSLNHEVAELRFGQLFLVVKHPALFKHWRFAQVL